MPRDTGSPFFVDVFDASRMRNLLTILVQTATASPSFDGYAREEIAEARALLIAAGFGDSERTAIAGATGCRDRMAIACRRRR